MKKIKSRFLFILFLVGSQFGFSQLKGKIVDKNNMTPLEYATVALYSQSPRKLITGVTNKFLMLQNFKIVKEVLPLM